MKNVLFQRLIPLRTLTLKASVFLILEESYFYQLFSKFLEELMVAAVSYSTAFLQ